MEDPPFGPVNVLMRLMIILHLGIKTQLQEGYQSPTSHHDGNLKIVIDASCQQPISGSRELSFRRFRSWCHSSFTCHHQRTNEYKYVPSGISSSSHLPASSNHLSCPSHTTPSGCLRLLFMIILLPTLVRYPQLLTNLPLGFYIQNLSRFTNKFGER